MANPNNVVITRPQGTEVPAIFPPFAQTTWTQLAGPMGILGTANPYGAATMGWRCTQLGDVVYLVTNAYFDGTNWNQDNGAEDSWAIVYNNADGTIRFEWAVAGFPPQPSPWQVTFAVGENGVDILRVNGALNMQGFPIINLGPPVDDNSAVSKGYVDALTPGGPGSGLLTLFPKQIVYGSPYGGIDQSVNFQYDFVTDTLHVDAAAFFTSTVAFGSEGQAQMDFGGNLRLPTIDCPTFYNNPLFTGNVVTNGSLLSAGATWHRNESFFGAGDQAHFDAVGGLFTNQPGGFVATFTTGGYLVANGNLAFDGADLWVGGNLVVGGILASQNPGVGPAGGAVYKSNDGSLRSGPFGGSSAGVYVQIGPIMIAYGSIVAPNPGGDNWQYIGAHYFPVPFRDPPAVVLTAVTGNAPPDSPWQGLTLINGVTPAGFDGWLHSGTSAGGNMLAFWIAVGTITPA